MQPDSGFGAVLAAEDVADLAGVSPGAVSNWAKRHSDFPKPVGRDGRRKLYERSDVMAWLEANRPELDLALGELERDFWRFVDAGEDLSPADALELIAWLVALRPDRGAGSPAELAATVEERWGIRTSALDDDVPAEAVDLVDRVADSDDKAGLDVLAAHLEKRSKSGQSILTGRLLEDLVGAAAIEPGQSVFDPAAGIGTLLRRVGSGVSGLTLVGGEPSEDAARLAAALNAAVGLDATMEVANPLMAPAEPHRFDRVIGLPPLGDSTSDVVDPADRRWVFGVPNERSWFFAWAQNVLFRLADGGLAVLATVSHPLAARGGPDAAIRTAMTKAGVLAAVVATPHSYPGSSLPASLVLLAPRQATANRQVLLVDLRSDGGSYDPGEWARWVLDEAPPQDPRCRLLDHAELVAQDFVLDPAAYAEPVLPMTSASDLDRTVDDLGLVMSDLSALSDEVAELERRLTDHPTGPSSEVSWPQLGDVAEIVLGKATPSKTGTLPLLSPRHVWDPDADVDGFTDANRHGADEDVSPGDLLVALTGQVGRTRLATEEDARLKLGHGVAAIRLRPGSPASSGWLSAWLKSDAFRDWVERLSAGATMPRLRLADLRNSVVPVPSPEDQRWAEGVGEIAEALTQRAGGFTVTLDLALDVAIRIALRATEGRAVDSTDWSGKERSTLPSPVVSGGSDRTPGRQAATDITDLEPDTYFLRSRGVTASGVPRSDRFMVEEGATGRLDPSKSLTGTYVRLRQALLDEGVLVRRADDLFLTKDYEFSSPTAAATALIGTNTNGLTAWVRTDGRTMKEVAKDA